jgi:CTP:molybdopterin cytidylyltransferase MocA
MPTATLSTKGQLVIPSRLRKALSLGRGRGAVDARRAAAGVGASIASGAKLARGKSGRPVLVAPGCPPMTTATVNAILAEESSHLLDVNFLVACA